jgi:hypothetical protein
MNLEMICMTEGFHYRQPPASAQFAVLIRDNHNGPRVVYFNDIGQTRQEVNNIFKNEVEPGDVMVYSLVSHQLMDNPEALKRFCK